MRSRSCWPQPSAIEVVEDVVVTTNESPDAAATDPVATDPDLPEVETLLGSGAAGVLSAALAPSGGRVGAVRISDISWWPGRSITVAYSAEVDWEHGGPGTVETVVATAGDSVPDGALLLEDGTHRLGLWRAPFDPALPGLAPALDPSVLAGLLADVGVEVDASTVSTSIASYRPGRRAVIEVTSPAARLFLKVVRPRKAQAIHERHRLLGEHVPVPTSLGWSPEHGVVVLEALPGITQRASFATDAQQPGPDALLALLDALPAPADGATSWGWRAHELGGVVAASAPGLADRIEDLAGRLSAVEESLVEPQVPVHGDLHDAQLMVIDGRITGLLDIDTHATGRRLDDLATMIGHLSVLATAVPHGERVRQHAQRLLAGFDQQVDPALLRDAVAAVVLGLATGPFRVQEHEWRETTEQRLELAEMWSDSAAALRGTR